ncbi:MAG: CHASE2 domain-containing protein, partial [Bdellovibrionia bacterium]
MKSATGEFNRTAIEAMKTLDSPAPFFKLPSFIQTPKQKRAWIGCLSLISLSFLWSSHLLPLDNLKRSWDLEQTTLDLRFSHFNRPRPSSDQVVLLDIDESSLKLLGPHFGKWPWPRSVYRPLLEFLGQGEPAAILFDLLFTEPSQNASEDQSLIEATRSMDAISHALLLNEHSSLEGSPKSLPLPPAFKKTKTALQWLTPPHPPFEQPRFRDFNLPPQTFLERIPYLHVVNSERDFDGLHRRLPLALQYDGTWLPSLTLQALLQKFPHSSLEFEETPSSRSTRGAIVLKSAPSSSLRIPVDHRGMLPLNFYRPTEEPEIIPIAAAFSSATRLQSGNLSSLDDLQINPLHLKGKIILIGASASGLNDLKSTPINPSTSGSLLHATAISNILKQDFLTFPHPAVQTGLNLFTWILIYGSVFFLSSVLLKVAIPLGWLLLYCAICLYAFQTQSLVLEMARPLVFGLLAIFDGIYYLTYREAKEKKALKETLSKYLPPSVTEILLSTGQNPTAEVGQSKELSVLFSDIRGFTSLSETMDPAQLVTLLNRYLGRMTDLVFEEMGTLDKFIGDAVMAFWGAPIADPEHARRAVTCALKMREALEQLNTQWSQQGIPPLSIGIGINTGEVIVGNIGSEKKLDYTVIGDHVNLASRLEGLTKQYGLSLIIGPRTHELIQERFLCRPLDFVAVKGKKLPVPIFEPLVEKSPQTPQRLVDLAHEFGEALNLYQRGKFSEALARFQRIDHTLRPHPSQDSGDAPSRTFIQRC